MIAPKSARHVAAVRHRWPNGPRAQTHVRLYAETVAAIDAMRGKMTRAEFIETKFEKGLDVPGTDCDCRVNETERTT